MMVKQKTRTHSSLVIIFLRIRFSFSLPFTNIYFLFQVVAIPVVCVMHLLVFLDLNHTHPLLRIQLGKN